MIRIDSLHQGDQDGAKGVYHINAVDCITQWEVVATCRKISEAYLLPVLQEILAAFPFTILGVHADKGSENITHRVARLLNKLTVELTKSRPRRSADNALAESKNGAVVHKVFGYGHITQHLVQTPLEKLASLSPEQRNLRPDTTLEMLQCQAAAMNDNEAAARLQKARTALFESSSFCLI